MYGLLQVEVSMLTGETKILQSDVVYDCGVSLNPAVDLGQVGWLCAFLTLRITRQGVITCINLDFCFCLTRNAMRQCDHKYIHTFLKFSYRLKDHLSKELDSLCMKNTLLIVRDWL